MRPMSPVTVSLTRMGRWFYLWPLLAFLACTNSPLDSPQRSLSRGLSEANSDALVYVANSPGDEIVVIDPSSNNVLDRIGLGDPWGLAFTPDGAFLYVSQRFNQVSVVETATNTIVATIPVGDRPTDITISPDGSLAYVSNIGIPRSLSVIETSSNTVVATLAVNIPVQTAFLPDGSFAYVTDFNAHLVRVFETAGHTEVATIALGLGPQGIASAPDGDLVYATTSREHRVYVIETATNSVVATIPTGDAPRDIKFTPGGELAYVPNFISGSVSVIETANNTVLATPVVGEKPVRVAITPDGSFAYVTNQVSGTVSVVETASNTVVATIPVGGQPFGVAITPAPPLIQVDIDIKPGAEPNCFNNDGHGVIPVAILGSAEFDVMQVDAATVQLEGLAVRAVGKADKLQSHIEDVNGDGFDDLLMQIEDVDGAFTNGDGIAVLTGELFDGTPIEGSDTICIVP